MEDDFNTEPHTDVEELSAEFELGLRNCQALVDDYQAKLQGVGEHGPDDLSASR